ncbi:MULTISPECIES: phage tail protein [unclassified Tenacibaculum]|uniref:phage tail protein n=1 Tax=unclassified Tenacibaculum TaxID=2635139 RepID=UPI001F2CFDAB|nr:MULTISPECIES: tail fiber protein [unclassified Tenacibaculum]MCF2873311.1 tail fiber protein [Tenacibaculum sp. Cn5-1]MCF2933467.1 tail fiber protein [Tenacibaculum sp. Cn5-34]MCG7509951.1 tail fiber protein [Tenacibaculum sp. Cn5-46]
MKLKLKFIGLLFICLLSTKTSNAQQEGFLGEVKMFAGNFAPRGWAICNGQLMAISSNTALFSILGTTYGGDGRTTFALPDFRGRVAISPGRHPGSLYDWRLGQRTGAETTVLTLLNLPAHTHAAAVTGLAATASASISIPASTETGNTSEPGNNVILSLGEVNKNQNELNMYSTETADASLKPFNVPVNVSLSGGTVTVSPTGNNAPFNNIQPVQVINYIICTQGVFPSRN